MSSRESLIRNFVDLIGMRSGKLSNLWENVLRAAELGIRSVMPENFMKRVRVEDQLLLVKDSLRVDLREFEEVIVLGAGKASIEMAEYMEAVLGDRISSGLIVSLMKPCECSTLRRIDVVPSSHPIPSELSVEASEMMMECAEIHIG